MKVSNLNQGFSIMAPLIFIMGGVIAGFITYGYSGNLIMSIIAGATAVPITLWLLDLIFNNPIALRFQNHAGNHKCPTCRRRYEAFMSQPGTDNTIILTCSECSSIHRFDKKYHHIGKIFDELNSADSDKT